MDKKLLTVFIILFLSMGCSTLMTANVREGAEGKAAPVITQSFASKEVKGDDMWKVYLNASDSDGGLKDIYAVVSNWGSENIL